MTRWQNKAPFTHYGSGWLDQDQVRQKQPTLWPCEIFPRNNHPVPKVRRFLRGPGLLHHQCAKSCMETFLPGRELQVSWGETEISEAECFTCVRDRLLQGQPTCPALLKNVPRAIAPHPVPDSSYSQMPKEDTNPRKASSDTSPEIPDTS